MPAPTLIAFDADDTLWPNQPHYDEAEARLYALLTHYADADTLSRRFNEMQRRDLPLLGYGAKSFIICMVETIISLTDGRVTGQEIQHILDHGKRLLDYPIEPLPDVRAVLEVLREQGHRLMLLTKGDLFDQESKLARSGLGPYFDHVEIVSEKNVASYQRILERYGLPPEEFLMIGNSLKSDILPVARLGARAVYVPYHTTWVMEEVPVEQLRGVEFHRVEALAEVVPYIQALTEAEA